MMPHDLTYYDMVGLKCPETEIAELKALLRQVYEGVTHEWHEWFKDDTYTGEELAWLAATRRALGTNAAQSSEGSSAAGS